jgi:coenzyme F420 hydrogenase subunit beta
MRQMSYGQSWGDILCNYTQFRCRLCADATGEFADIACGDPWYREIQSGEEGWSLVLVRTEKAREILHNAMKADYVKLQRVEPDTVPRSQESLLRRRRHLWGRLLMMQMMRIPIPRYAGFRLFSNWLDLSFIEKLRSTGGTLRRILFRGWIRPVSTLTTADRLQRAPVVRTEPDAA